MTKQKQSVYALLTAALLAAGIIFSGLFTQAYGATISNEQMKSASEITTEEMANVTNDHSFFKFIPPETGVYEVAVYGNTSNDPGMLTLFDVNQWPYNWVDETTDCDQINTSAGFSVFLIKDYKYFFKGNAYSDEPFGFTLSLTRNFKAFASSCQSWNITTTESTALHTSGQTENLLYDSTAVKITPTATMTGTLTARREGRLLKALLLDAEGNVLTIGDQNTHYSTVKGTFKAGEMYYLIPSILSEYEEDFEFEFSGTQEKKANPLSVKARTAKVSYKKLKTKARTLNIKKLITFKANGKGQMKYKLVSAKKGSRSFKKYFTINAKTGKVTVKKGLAKGTYKVQIKLKAAGNSSYNASAWISVTCRIKVA